MVVDTLQSEADVATYVSDADMTHVMELIERWQRLECVAQERLAQSQQLTGLYRDMMALQASLDDTEALLGKQDFTDVTTLETVIFAVQVGP